MGKNRFGETRELCGFSPYSSTWTFSLRTTDILGAFLEGMSHDHSPKSKAMTCCNHILILKEYNIIYSYYEYAIQDTL